MPSFNGQSLEFSPAEMHAELKRQCTNFTSGQRTEDGFSMNNFLGDSVRQELANVLCADIVVAFEDCLEACQNFLCVGDMRGDDFFNR